MLGNNQEVSWTSFKVRPDCSSSESVLILNELRVIVAKCVQDARSLAWYTKNYNVFDKPLNGMLTVADTGLQLIVLFAGGFIRTSSFTAAHN